MLKMQKTLNLAKGTITLSLINGTTEPATRATGQMYEKFTATNTLESIEFNPVDFPDELKLHAQLHGWSQKLGDVNASIKGAQLKYNASVKEAQRLLDEKTWNKVGKTTELKVKISDIVAKLMEGGKTQEEAEMIAALLSK